MRVLFFALTRDAAGTSELEISVSDSCGVDELWQVLISARPGLAVHRLTTRLARNGEYVNPGTVFQDTDEVALIPPVSGG